VDDARRVVPHPPLGSACGGQLLTRRAPLNTSSIVSGEGHRRHRHGSLRVDANVGGARRGGGLPGASGTDEPGDRGRGFLDLLLRFDAASVCGVQHAVSEVIVQQLQRDGLEGLGDG
jgi:hypothetical protein